MSVPSTLSHYHVVVADDNPDHCYLLRSAIARLGISDLTTFSNGAEVIEYVQRTGRKPSILFIDLNMPVKDGFDVLSALKSQPEWRGIPIIVTTSSEEPTDIAECYRLGANSYIIKPMSFDAFSEKVQSVASYWMKVTALPPA